jgi:glycosyltransferase involved in cell wall biosynthesis
MNVLWFSHLVPYPETGLGVLQRSSHLLKRLAHAHRVHLVAFVQGAIIRELLGDLDAGLSVARRHLLEYCADVHFLPIPSEQWRWGRSWLAVRSLAATDPYTIRWLYSRQAHRLAMTLNATRSFDVVHFDTLSLAPYRSLFAQSALTLNHHNIESHMMRRRAGTEVGTAKRIYFWQEGVRLAWFERRVCKEFDLNITCSPMDTERLMSVAPGIRVAEVPNGVDTDYFRPNDEPEQPLSLIFAGNMSWYPNAAAMLFFADQVWPRLKVKLPGVRMDLVGANPPLRLLRLAESDPAFRVHGFVPDVRPLMAQAAVYICPIMDGGGTKLKILDALAMGKAIVAHPIACEGINVCNGRNIVFAEEPEEFIAGIAELFHDDERRRRLSQNARRLAESEYSYERIGRKLTAELEQCCARFRMRAER